MYCQKGVKCPFLTESLDVLQTLLSDEEEVAQDEKTDVITIESDHEVAEEFGPKSTSPRKSRKVCMAASFWCKGCIVFCMLIILRVVHNSQFVNLTNLGVVCTSYRVKSQQNQKYPKTKDCLKGAHLKRSL